MIKSNNVSKINDEFGIQSQVACAFIAVLSANDTNQGFI